MYVEDGRENPICVSAALFRDRFSALVLSGGSKVGKEWRYDERERSLLEKAKKKNGRKQLSHYSLGSFNAFKLQRRDGRAKGEI